MSYRICRSSPTAADSGLKIRPVGVRIPLATPRSMEYATLIKRTKRIGFTKKFDHFLVIRVEIRASKSNAFLSTLIHWKSCMASLLLHPEYISRLQQNSAPALWRVAHTVEQSPSK